MTIDRSAARHALISIVARRQKPGSGSLPSELMRSRRERMDWWTEALASLGGVRHAVAGAVAAKLISGRAVDVADLSRMLGAASAESLAAVRGAVTRHLPDARDDLEQLIVLGKLEYEPPRPDQP